MEKINIAELLENCPTDMELDCTMFYNLYLSKVDKIYEDYPIKCYTLCDGKKETISFNEFGEYDNTLNSKCVIFPKGKTTWEGFQRPFKDGDILAYDNFASPTIFIYRYDNPRWNTSYFVGFSSHRKKFFSNASGALCSYNPNVRFATEEEKEQLFKAIKDNGFKWNSETKTLEKLVKPIFEVGNKIEKCGSRFTITEVKDDYYLTKCNNKIPFENQDGFSLVSDKFDISTLIPFESKVLVRNTQHDNWKPAIYGVKKISLYYVVGGNSYWQCIPYERNEYLLGTAKDCDEFYRTWKE